MWPGAVSLALPLGLSTLYRARHGAGAKEMDVIRILTPTSLGGEAGAFSPPPLAPTGTPIVAHSPPSSPLIYPSNKAPFTKPFFPLDPRGHLVRQLEQEVTTFEIQKLRPREGA